MKPTNDEDDEKEFAPGGPYCMEDRVRTVGDLDLYNYIRFLERKVLESECILLLKNYKKTDTAEDKIDIDNNVEEITESIVSKKLDTLASLGMCLTVLNILSLVGIYYL
jgi:hypothetical protein